MMRIIVCCWNIKQ